eukprot:CAMPEP_0174230960 /NCGR_PEP_ID=MMETSP0417-20130205/1594_1 /TAXON_ID=242541 /ORGANISM="Mayorella sp, Strain BSH-02190019" /LENGTH=196 /DNA_ID=CAMNT_0015308737 /DNA_START=188 /DNA_END=778 /DNA_ORIENTATION=-
MASPKKAVAFAGPSGSGKSTLIKYLQAEFPGKFGFSVSHTTRSARPGEKDGVDYHFSDRDTILKMVEQGKFVEWAEYSGNIYGTSVKAVEDVMKADKVCILDIDIQGIIQVKATPSLDPFYVFISPPSVEVLEQRLKGRGDTDDDAIAKRLAAAKHELTYMDKPGYWDFVLVNSDLANSQKLIREFFETHVLSQHK